MAVSKQVLLIVGCACVLLCALIGLEIWQNAALKPAPQAESGGELVEPEGFLPVSGEPEPSNSEPCHIAFYQGGLAVYAGPAAGEGELLRPLNLPLSALPPRWLAQLSNGGIEFASEEELLMALDNLDELVNQ